MSGDQPGHPRPAGDRPASRELEADQERMLGGLRWVTLLTPLLLAVLLELTHLFVTPLFSPWVDGLLVGALVLTVAAVFYNSVFGRLEQIQAQLAQQNRELLSLHDAGLAVVSDLSLDSALQNVVRMATELVGTRYGALSVIDDDKRIQSFTTAGIDRQTELLIGHPPEGRGVLGIVLHKGQRLRLEHLRDHPSSVGFPEHHPPMDTLLAVPIVGKSPYRGNLYLSEKRDGSAFSAQDEETLVRFANQAAIAIDNAYLHRKVREMAAARERISIAHEMHDGVAQVLAFVNTQSQVVREYCRQGNLDRAEQQLELLSKAARQVYTDVRAQILDLRTSQPTDKDLLEAIEEYVASWQEHTEVEVELELPDELALQPDEELQVLRIAQEALTNVRKHAAATSVEIAVRLQDDRLEITIADDGRGFDVEAKSRGSRPKFGLATMQERAQALGGTLTIDSTPGEGTRVHLGLPRGRH